MKMANWMINFVMLGVSTKELPSTEKWVSCENCTTPY